MLIMRDNKIKKLTAQVRRLEHELKCAKLLSEDRRSKIRNLERRLRTPDHEVFAAFEAEFLNGRDQIDACMECHRLKDKRGKWRSEQDYLRPFTHAHFTHGICRDCLPDFREKQGLPRHRHRAAKRQ